MIAAIMPCRGRIDQTIRNVKRLLATAGDVEWRLYLVGATPDVRPLAKQIDPTRVAIQTVAQERAPYWQALQAMWYETDEPLLVNLANDLLPGQHWLQRAYAGYRQTFGDGPGLLGFNDGHHETNHSCHFLISRSLLERYGGWPVWYDHNYGDTELCERAIADGLYAKAPWATLFHDHPYFGGDDDRVYAEGRAKVDQDRELFNRRKANGWRS
jgi:hypothetical protein